MSNWAADWNKTADAVESKRYDGERFIEFLNDVHALAAASQAWGMARRVTDIMLAYDAIIRAQDVLSERVDDLLAYLRREDEYRA